MSEEDNENTDSNKKEDIPLQLIWNSLSKNYNLVEGAQLSNSFVILLSLIYSNEYLTTKQISNNFKEEQR